MARDAFGARERGRGPGESPPFFPKLLRPGPGDESEAPERSRAEAIVRAQEEEPRGGAASHVAAGGRAKERVRGTGLAPCKEGEDTGYFNGAVGTAALTSESVELGSSSPVGASRFLTKMRGSLSSTWKRRSGTGGTGEEGREWGGVSRGSPRGDSPNSPGRVSPDLPAPRLPSTPRSRPPIPAVSASTRTPQMLPFSSCLFLLRLQPGALC